jgi:hypothetical protein
MKPHLAKTVLFAFTLVLFISAFSGTAQAQSPRPAFELQKLTAQGITLFENQRLYLSVPRDLAVTLFSSANGLGPNQFTISDTGLKNEKQEKLWVLTTGTYTGAAAPRLTETSGAGLKNAAALAAGAPITIIAMPTLTLAHSLGLADGEVDLHTILGITAAQRDLFDYQINNRPEQTVGISKTFKVSALKTGVTELEVVPMAGGEFIARRILVITTSVPILLGVKNTEADPCRELDTLSTALSKAEYDIRQKELSEKCADAEAKAVVTKPNFLSYNEVKDNYGRRIAKQYVVVEVKVNNQSENKQFVLQNIAVGFDPQRCEALATPYKVDTSRIQFNTDNPRVAGAPPVLQNRDEFVNRIVSDCFQGFYNNFKYSVEYQSADRNTVMGVGEAGRLKNPRANVFSAIQFVASIGSALAGLNVLGTDGVKAFGLLGGSLTTSAKNALPDMTVTQLTNLTDKALAANTLIEVKDHKTFSIFIPINKMFSAKTWKMYKQSRGNEADVELQRVAQITVVSSATGIFVSAQNNKPVTSVNQKEPSKSLFQ